MTNVTNHFLYPACILVSKEPYAVKTILGSCVSVCLWDKVLQTGGMNHFLLPLWNGNSLPSPKYGNIAIERLIEKMQNNGSQKRNLVAKLFGGSQYFNSESELLNIGQRNIAIAREILSDEHIPVISEDTGGKQGRLLIFYTASGQVLKKTINSSQVESQSLYKAG